MEVTQANIDAIKKRIADLNNQLTKDTADYDKNLKAFNEAMAIIGNCTWYGGLFDKGWKCYGVKNQDDKYHAAERSRDAAAAKMNSLSQAISKAKADIITATGELATAIDLLAKQNETNSLASMTPEQKQAALNQQAARDLAAKKAQDNAKIRSTVTMVLLVLVVVVVAVFIIKKVFRA